VITTLANRTGRYAKTSERTELGDYQDPQPFLTRMGVPNCEVSGTAQPNNPSQPTARHKVSPSDSCPRLNADRTPQLMDTVWPLLISNRGER
jgi:hypothetical protein